MLKFCCAATEKVIIFSGSENANFYMWSVVTAQRCVSLVPMLVELGFFCIINVLDLDYKESIMPDINNWKEGWQ